MSLVGKKVVITGANGVLGSAVVAKALELKAEHLALIDIVVGQPLADAIEQKISRHVVDLTDLSATRECLESLSGVDVVLNLAGGFDMGPTTYEVTDESWDFLFNLNVKTMHNVVRAAVPLMLKNGGGSIVNIGAIGAVHGNANMSAYSASKGGVMKLTESLSQEVRHQGINVNAVLPSVIDTERNRQDMPDVDPNVWVKPEQLANVICFLASDAAGAVHGALVPVCGLS